MLRRRLAGRLLPCALSLLLVIAAGVFLAVKLPAALAPIAAGERLLSFCAALFVLNRAPAECKTYRLLLLFLPWIGAILCFFLRAKRDVLPAPRAPYGDETANAVASLASGPLSPSFCERATFFCTGKEMSEALFADLRAAREEILLDYYILARGVFFDTVLQILEKKARDGLTVELVYDDFGCAKLPKNFARTLRARGIRATVFGRLRPFALFRLNLRDHRKLAVIDKKIAYTGGVNLADEYVGETVRFGHWKDAGVRVEGEAAAEFCALFGKNPARNAKRIAKTAFPCVPFADEAGDGKHTGEEILNFLVCASRHTLEICTPYLVPGERLLASLRSAARAGVRVRLMIPHVPDKRTALLLSRAYARELGKSGVQTREYTAGFLHQKSLTADGRYAAVGSYNLDRRSLYSQAECGVFVADEALAGDIARDFDAMWEAGVPVKKETFPEKCARLLLLPFLPWI